LFNSLITKIIQTKIILHSIHLTLTKIDSFKIILHNSRNKHISSRYSYAFQENWIMCVFGSTTTTNIF